MIVYNKIQQDPRVIRAAEAIAALNEKICVLSCNSDKNYENSHFKSIIYTSKRTGPLLLIFFWIYMVKFCILHRKHIKLLYINNYPLLWIGNIISNIIRKKWIYDAYELLIQRKTHTYSKRELFFLFMEKWTIKKACLVIEANKERERIIRTIYKLKSTMYIQNIMPKSHITINTDSKKNIIVYQGVISEERKIHRYIQALRHLPEDISMKLIGDGSALNFCKSVVREYALDRRVLFTGVVPYSAVREESMFSKVGIISYLMDDTNNYYCAPNKIFEYAQSKIPMLFSPQPFFKEVIKKYQIGEIIAEEMNDMELANMFKYMMDNYNKYLIGMDDFLKDYNWENEKNKLQKVISNLI
jgi:glycosyltransferase involved in cell wall biosynthesis